MSVINVQKIVDSNKSEILSIVKELEIKPKLATIIVGERPDSKIYVKAKDKVITQDCEMDCETFSLTHHINQEDLEAIVIELNNDSNVHGILLQLPLPEHLDANKVIALIDPLKDVDGLTPTNQAKLYMGEDERTFIQPCTPMGIIEILENEYPEGLETKEILVSGRSNLLGNPLTQMLKNRNATVLQLHSKSFGVEHYLSTFNPSIVCLCTGQRDYLKAVDIISSRYKNKSLFSSLNTIIDAGIIRDQETNKIRGDFRKEDYDLLDSHKEFKHIDYTTVPKGVGIMTTTMLAFNLLKCYLIQQDKNK